MTRDERQEIVVQNFFKAKGRGIFLGSVGFGKTRVAINIIKKLKEKKDSLTVTILVPTTILLKQWKKIINDYELNDTCEVRTFKSLSKKLVNSDLLIIDELHASLSKNGIDRIRDSRFPLFLGLTATINRIDENEKFILKHFPIFDTVTKEECIKNNWSVRELERQKGSMLFERLALSKDKNGLLRLAYKGQELNSYEDMIKDPYVLEFTGLSPQSRLYENKLEQAIIDNLSKFLLELGKGFTFVAR